MVEATFTVLEVKRYKGTKFVSVFTDAEGTHSRFWVLDSDIWQVGNVIKRTCKLVSARSDKPNTVYTNRVRGLYEIESTLIGRI
jgi:hypothetical protein